MRTLVFLEHHGNELLESSLGVLSKAATLGGDDLTGVIAGAGVRALAEEAGKYGATTVYVADDPQLEAPLSQPRVDVLARLVRDRGIDIVREDGKLVGKRPALQDTVYADVGWSSEPRIALFRSGSFDPTPNGGSVHVE